MTMTRRAISTCSLYARRYLFMQDKRQVIGFCLRGGEGCRNTVGQSVLIGSRASDKDDFFTEQNKEKYSHSRLIDLLETHWVENPGIQARVR